jgi:uncharacterized repeat protein (TIGR01451 family)
MLITRQSRLIRSSMLVSVLSIALVCLFSFIPGKYALALVEIDSLEDLQAMQANLSEEYRLVADIDASATANWNDGAGFDPVGTEDSPFTGTVDGGGHVIRGLFINRPTQNLVGLFGRTEGATITDLHLVDADVSGQNAVGILAGQVETTTIQRCSAAGTVTGILHVGLLAGYSFATKIGNCHSIGSVDGDSRVGGLIGLFSNADLTHSSSVCSVTAADQGVGGLLGANAGTVADCFSVGTVRGQQSVGGFVGSHQGSITNSYSACSVVGSGAVGGFMGENLGGTDSSCYWDTQRSGLETTAGTALGKLTAQMVQATTFNGWDFAAIWQIFEGGSYPFFDSGIATDLIVDLMADKASAQKGDTLTYTATITNQGFLPALGGSLLVSLPDADLKGLQYSLNQGGTWLDLPDSGGVDLGDIMADQAVTVMVRGVVVIDGPGHISGVVRGFTAVVDTDAANDSASVKTQINVSDPPEEEQTTDLTVSLTSDKATAKNGDRLTFTALLTNQGAHTALDVELILRLSQAVLTGLAYSLDDGDTWLDMPGNSRLGLDDVTVGESVKVLLRGQLNIDGPKSIQAEVQGVTSVIDTDAFNDSAAVEIQITADLPSDDPSDDPEPVASSTGGGGGGGCFIASILGQLRFYYSWGLDDSLLPVSE